MPIEINESAICGRNSNERRPPERTPAPGLAGSEEQAFPDPALGACVRPTRLDAVDFRTQFKCFSCKPLRHGWARSYASHANYLPGKVLESPENDAKRHSTKAALIAVPDGRHPQPGTMAASGDGLAKIGFATILPSGELEERRQIHRTFNYLGEDACPESSAEPNVEDAVADCHQRSSSGASPGFVAQQLSDLGPAQEASSTIVTADVERAVPDCPDAPTQAGPMRNHSRDEVRS